MNKKHNLFLALLSVASIFAQAQSDEGTCADHPLFTRMNGFYIAECKTEFGEQTFTGPGYKLIGGASKDTKVEGAKTSIVYKLKEGAAKPSSLQIRRNYGNAIKSIGGQVVMETAEWDAGNADLITLKQTKGGKTVWAQVYVHHFADGQEFVLTVVEPEQMQQDVAANDLLKELNERGFVTFHINFPTGSAAIGADGQEAVAQIAGLLEADPTLRLSIEGHTDNKGTAASNATLSQKRAKAVMDAVGRKVPGSVRRLKFKGFGQSKPVAGNSTEEGRAQNRRVEVVKW